MTTTRSRRLAALVLLASGSILLGGCGRHHRHELQAPAGEPPLTEPGEEPKPVRINNSESPAVLRWAGGD